MFLYNRATGERRFEVTNRLTTGFTQSIGFWDPGWQIHPANLNGDEYTDFFLYDPVRGLWFQALNHAGDGTFTYTAGSWDNSWMVVPADLDGDRLTDMLVYNVTNGLWVKCFVDGAGGFKGYAVGSWDPAWTFTTADLNADGRDDFLLYNPVNGVWVEAFSQEGFGTFDYPASGQWDPGWQVTGADLNGDRRTDLFLLNAAGMHVSALSRASGSFDYVGGPRWLPGWSLAPGDLNNDGTTDLFLYNPANGIWSEAFSDGAGDFTYRVGAVGSGLGGGSDGFQRGRAGRPAALARGRYLGPGDQHRRRELHVCCGRLGTRLDGVHQHFVRPLIAQANHNATPGAVNTSCLGHVRCDEAQLIKPFWMFARLVGVAATVVVASIVLNQVPVRGQQTPVPIPDTVGAAAGQGQLVRIIVGVRVDGYRPEGELDGPGGGRRSAPTSSTASIRSSAG